MKIDFETFNFELSILKTPCYYLDVPGRDLGLGERFEGSLALAIYIFWFSLFSEVKILVMFISYVLGICFAPKSPGKNTVCVHLSRDMSFLRSLLKME